MVHSGAWDSAGKSQVDESGIDDSSDDETGTVMSEMTTQDDWDVLSLSTSYSDVSSASKDKASPFAQEELSRMFNDESNVLPLLVASRPAHQQVSSGRYTVAIKRASLKQPFGLSFHGTEGSDRQLSKITIAEDLPQFGIQRFDELVFVDRRRPKSIAECRSLLQEALSLTLVLERRPQEGVTECLDLPNSCGKTGAAAACSSGAREEMRHVLAITKPTVLDHDRLGFTLVVQRCSLAQRFGISFSTDCKKDKDTGQEMKVVSSRGAAKKPQYSFWSNMRAKPSGPVVTGGELQKERTRENNLEIKVGTSVPQMGLKKGDKLVSINGVVPKSKMKCLRIYQTSLVVKLVFRRKSERKLAKLKAKAQEIDLEHQASCSLVPSCF